jgi:hypothetical protein
MPTRAKRTRPSKGGKSEPELEGGHQNARSVPPGPSDGTPSDVEEALERARRHGRAATAEAIAAVRALLDAASLGVSGEPSESHAGLASLARGLDELAASFASESSDRSSPMVEAILDALDSEIRRWEARSAGDMEARAVLRAFLGVREILWEFGLRRGEAGGAEPPRQHSAETGEPTPRRGASQAGKSRMHADPKPPRRSRRRVQRVEVQG